MSLPWMGQRRRAQIQRLIDLLDEKLRRADAITTRVRAIRHSVAQGEPQASVARRLGMHPNTVQEIVGRKRFKHID